MPRRPKTSAIPASDTKTPQLPKRALIRVGLIIDSAYTYGRGITEGVNSYAIAAGWRLDRQVVTIWSLANYWPDIEVDGIIAMVYSQGLADQLRQHKVPVVNVASVFEPTGFPSVVTDNLAVGRLAASHFLERGFNHLAMVYSKRTLLSYRRRDGFADAAAGRAKSLHEFCEPIPGLDQSATGDEVRQGIASLKKWLVTLPKPAAIYATGDRAGAVIIDAAHDVGRHVPEDLAVLGTDDDTLIVNASIPPLSSIQMPSFAVGYQAAQMLEQLMAGQALPSTSISLQPLGITVRASSELLAIEDPDVALALRFIRDNVAAGVGVEEVLRVVPLSRRPLERKFRKQLERTILEEIHRSRFERAKTLLTSTDLAITAVATKSGFGNPSHFSTLFKQSVGMGPMDYRKNSGQKLTSRDDGRIEIAE